MKGLIFAALLGFGFPHQRGRDLVFPVKPVRAVADEIVFTLHSDGKMTVSPPSDRDAVVMEKAPVVKWRKTGQYFMFWHGKWQEMKPVPETK